MKAKKILVTGGLGFIGSNLARRCLQLGADVTVYDNLDPRCNGSLYNIADIRGDLRLKMNDVLDFDTLAEAVREQDVIFNCAAFTSHPQSMKEPLLNIEVNCRGVLTLLEALRMLNPNARFVQVGTSTQIGRMLYSPIDEQHPEFPVDIYSANKSAAEKYVLIYASAHRMGTTVVRLANVFGPRSRISSPDFGFVNYFVGLALQGKELTVYGDGAQLRNITYVEDCVEALICAGEDSRSIGQVFFATSDVQYSVAEIAGSISMHIGGNTRFVPWPAGRELIDVGDAVISNAKIRQTLGWSPQTSLTNGLARTRDYFTSCLAQYLR
jgi:UDP-glucose 4-epimerase